MGPPRFTDLVVELHYPLCLRCKNCTEQHFFLCIKTIQHLEVGTLSSVLATTLYYAIHRFLIVHLCQHAQHRNLWWSWARSYALPASKVPWCGTGSKVTRALSSNGSRVNKWAGLRSDDPEQVFYGLSSCTTCKDLLLACSNFTGEFLNIV